MHGRHSSFFIDRLGRLFTSKSRYSPPQKRRRRSPSIGTRSDYLKRKEAARSLVNAKLAFYNAEYGFTWMRVAIRNQRSRWGSCSRKGNLNFHYRIIDLPDDIADYIIVHELCHLNALHHRKEFWDLIARTIPDHRQKRMRLRQIERMIISSRPMQVTTS